MSAAALDVSGITVTAGGTTIVAAASFTAPAGAVTALLGPNGAGKSTLLRAVAGVEAPADGRVLFGGSDLLALPRRERARRVALVEQDATTELALTVRDVVALGRSPHESLLGGRDARGAQIVDAALRTAGAEEFAGRELPSLSGGERQRVMLARALAQQPELLLLDEPTNHLDVGAQLGTLALLGRLARDGATVVAALHDLTLAASHADAVVVLAGGRVVASGATLDTLTPELVREVYRVEARWVANPLTGRPMLAVAERR